MIVRKKENIEKKNVDQPQTLFMQLLYHTKVESSVGLIVCTH